MSNFTTILLRPIRVVGLLCRRSKRGRARHGPYSVFISYRRNNGNPVSLAKTLNHKLFRDAVYLDVLDPEVRELDAPELRYPGKGQANPAPSSPRSRDRRGVALGRILSRRLREAEIVLLLLDKLYQDDFKIASER